MKKIFNAMREDYLLVGTLELCSFFVAIVLIVCLISNVSNNTLKEEAENTIEQRQLVKIGERYFDTTNCYESEEFIYHRNEDGMIEEIPISVITYYDSVKFEDK